MRMMCHSLENRFTQKMVSLSLSWSHVMAAQLPIHAVANQTIRHLSRRQLVEALMIRPLVEVQTIQQLAEALAIQLLVEALAILHLQVKIQPALAMTYKLRSLSLDSNSLLLKLI